MNNFVQELTNRRNVINCCNRNLSIQIFANVPEESKDSEKEDVIVARIDDTISSYGDKFDE